MKDGRYNARAIDFGIEVNENTANASVNILFRVSEDQDEANKIITWRGYCTENAIQRTVEALRHMGWIGNDLSNFESSEGDKCERMLPNEVSIVVESEEYEGKLQSKVRWVNKIGSGKVMIKNRLEGAGAKSFGARFKAACQAVPVDAAAKAAAPNNSKPPAQKRAESSSNQDADPEYPF